jgi:hypothetical protein
MTRSGHSPDSIVTGWNCPKTAIVEKVNDLMTDMPRHQWKRLSLEAAAIVGSILLAFWIDAAWDQREDAARERTLLETLLSDMQEFQSAREARDAYFDAIIESGRSLLDIGRGLKPDATDREIDYLLNDMTYTSSDASKGLPILELIFEGGGLVNIESRELRACLADFRFSLNVEMSYVKRELEFVDNVFYKFLDINSSLAQIWGAEDGRPGNASSTMFPMGRESIQQSEISHRDLLENRQFQNIVIRKILYVENVKGWEVSAYDVDAQLSECIDLIESVIDD